MTHAQDLYKKLSQGGITPLASFHGPEYEILIPVENMSNIKYQPAYAQEYRRRGIYDISASATPTLYYSLVQLNLIGKIEGIVFRITDMLRPSDFQAQKRGEWEAANPGKGGNPFSVDSPHCRGCAVDIIPELPDGRPLTQPKWLPNLMAGRTAAISRNQAGPRPTPAAKYEAKLIAQADGIHHLEKFKDAHPLKTPHLIPHWNAPDELKQASMNADYLAMMAGSAGMLCPINSENWHFQIADARSYPILSERDIRRTAPGHAARIKKEMTDYANATFGVFYNRQIDKGTPHSMWLDKTIDKSRLIDLERLRRLLGIIKTRQKNI